MASLCVIAGTACSGGELPPVPPIDDPKDARSAHPCELVSARQLNALGLANGERGTNELGPQCVWRGPGSKELTLTLYTKGNGLAMLASHSVEAASRVRIEGYPAVETFTEQGVYCEYDVGVAPNQALIATMTGGQPDSCTRLQDVLAGVLENLPAYES